LPRANEISRRLRSCGLSQFLPGNRSRRRRRIAFGLNQATKPETAIISLT
jgi:hypothetical protein